MPEHSEAARRRDDDFWLPDGNVLLVAGNVEFRVYQGILVLHSPVFKDMLSLPQPAACDPPKPSVASPPVVHLTDSASELRHVLGVYIPRPDLR